MKHHLLLSFDDGLEIACSDIKKDKSGSEYVTIYFEQPNERKDDFKPRSAIIHAVISRMSSDIRRRNWTCC